MTEGNKKITFLLPAGGTDAVGGFKVVYEYANRLVEAGFDVLIVYAMTLNFKRRNLNGKMHQCVQVLQNLIKGYSPGKWFNLDPRVKQKWALTLNSYNVPESDIYVATAVETAYYLKDYKHPKDHCVYFIQHFEDWCMTKKEVLDSYGFGFLNICISDWLAKIINDSGNKCLVIKNGFDFNYFHYNIPVTERYDHTLSMMYNPHPSKGCKFGFKAIKKLKERFPDMRVKVFSKESRPDWLEQWIEFYKLPDKETHNYIYNSSAVYLAPSLTEGWGLPVGEAMMCGAAVVCTDNPGFREMVTPGVNGLMFSPGDVDAMYQCVSSLFEDRDLRIKLALSGRKSIQAFSWNKSFEKMLEVLKKMSRLN